MGDVVFLLFVLPAETDLKVSALKVFMVVKDLVRK